MFHNLLEKLVRLGLLLGDGGGGSSCTVKKPLQYALQQHCLLCLKDRFKIQYNMRFHSCLNSSTIFHPRPPAFLQGL